MKKNYMRGVAAALIAAAIIVVAAVIAAIPSCKNTLEFSARYFFVCYKSTDDAYSASTISSTVQSYGGAGYIVKLGQSYYVTVACYYSDEDAQSICSTLVEEGLSCTVVEAYIGGYELPSRLSDSRDSILGSLTVLNQLGTIFYEAANAIDVGTLSNSAAQSVLSDARTALCGIMNGNQGNALYDEVKYLIALVDDIVGDYIYAREIRALQIAVCDALLNVNFV
ncbi:MAG TPA: hypothetical protein IAC67_00410 [Candidatus Coproplasma excrementipullorum]|nr:hypothetical protein [Candidatus Coproplasma excrementipullorum]